MMELILEIKENPTVLLWDKHAMEIIQNKIFKKNFQNDQKF